jgi:hypothetical protein
MGAGFTAAILATGLPAKAEDGKVVALEVDNLDGVPGKTGTIKIQLHPEWAPNGVKRFEVCDSPHLVLVIVGIHLSTSWIFPPKHYSLTYQSLFILRS